MNRSETVKLVALISQIWPSMKINEFTADVWHDLLEDLDPADAKNAVTTLGRTRSGYIDMHDIRYQCADTAGLLPPDEATALQMAVTVAGNLGTGARMLPPAVREAYWDMGGSQGFAAPRSVLRPQWAKVYRTCCERIERELIGGNLGAAIEHQKRQQLTGGSAPRPSTDVAMPEQRQMRRDEPPPFGLDNFGKMPEEG